VSIELVRIDDRLIHGQIVMAWSKAIAVKRMVVIDDQVAADVIRKMLLETVAPPGVKVSVFTTAQGIQALQDNKFGNEKLLLLCTNPMTIVLLIEGGIMINKVNIGGMSFSLGKTQLTKAVSVDENDRKAFKRLHEHGVVLEIQILPNDTPVDIMSKI
jgi:mannose/fructose/sorbose-specific phosphotransferase system IIB component